MPRVLVVEDDPAMRELVSYALTEEGMHASGAADGEEAMALFGAERTFDLVIIDVSLPGMDGLHLCRKLRSTSNVPVVMLTARAEEVDVVAGLEVGADDYITKPFGQRELISRVRAQLRRRHMDAQEPGREILEFPGLEIDLSRRRVVAGGEEAELTAAQFDVLALLASHPGRVYTRAQILGSLWGGEPICDSRAADVQIQNLRREIEPDPKHPRYVLTVRGAGYKFFEP